MCFTETTTLETVDRRLTFCFEFEGRRFPTSDPSVTPSEIRSIVGGIPSDIPIVQILDDGTQRTIPEAESVRLVHCIRVRRLPRFIRG